MKIHKKIIQGSDEWKEIRKGKMTASHAQEIGNCGKGLDTYIFNVMAKYYSSGVEEEYMNEHMERGILLEDDARKAYCVEMFSDVEEVGFIEYNDYIGCSPDGLIGDEGGIEIKCKSDTKFIKNLLEPEKEIESKYIWQIQMNLLITGRSWWDYVAYNPNFEKNMVIVRILPDEEKFSKLLNGFGIGITKIKSIKKRLPFS